MSDHPTPDIFEVKLNDEGVYYLRKIERLAPFVTVMAILLSVLYFISGVYGILSVLKINAYGTYRYNLTDLFARNFFILIVAVLNLYMLNQFLRFVRFSMAGINNQDEQAFNKSFQYLLRNLYLGLLTGVVNVISLLFSYFTLFMQLQ